MMSISCCSEVCDFTRKGSAFWPRSAPASCAENITTRGRGVMRLISCSSSQPEPSGKPRSSSTISKRSRASLAVASRTDSAGSKSAMSRAIVATTLRTSGSSSTCSTRGRAAEYGRQPRALHLAQIAKKAIFIDRLADPVDHLQVFPVQLQLAFLRGSRHHDDRQMRHSRRAPQFPDERQAVLIRKHEIDRHGGVVLAKQQGFGLGRIIGDIRSQSGILEHELNQLAHIGIVLAHQDTRTRVRRSRRVRRNGRRQRSLAPLRKLEIKSGSLARLGKKPDLAPQPFDDRLRNAQTQSGPSFLARVRSVGLGEFLEDALAKVIRYSGAIDRKSVV